MFILHNTIHTVIICFQIIFSFQSESNNLLLARRFRLSVLTNTLLQKNLFGCLLHLILLFKSLLVGSVVEPEPQELELFAFAEPEPECIQDSVPGPD
jgi:hypothetical protein